jgi:hypothetical protein
MRRGHFPDSAVTLVAAISIAAATEALGPIADAAAICSRCYKCAVE